MQLNIDVINAEKAKMEEKNFSPKCPESAPTSSISVHTQKMFTVDECQGGEVEFDKDSTVNLKLQVFVLCFNLF